MDSAKTRSQGQVRGLAHRPATVTGTRRGGRRVHAPLWPLLATLLLAQPVAAQQALPSPEDVLGHPLGARFTEAAELVRYLEALAAASSNVRLERYGETPERRPLVQAVMSTPDNLARLDQILAANRELVDPNTAVARASAIAAANPAVVYFSYGVHGNESSSSEAALWTAWDLARGAEGLDVALSNLVVVIDPAANPDGRDRYVHGYVQSRGAVPNPSPNAREHWEPWPGGRFNHYLFDLNRDWAWATQAETQARLATWERWSPQVHVDFHEMSYTSSYFFFPAAAPINPMYPQHILSWGQYFGQANAQEFDRRGWAYYTAESFDLFYPGYGDTWPSLVGAVGMTYEQAGHGRAGLIVRRPDGTLLTLRDRATRHRASGAATLRAAAHRRAELLRDFAAFHRGTGQGMPDILLVPGEDAGRMEALVALLHRQGIRVERTARPFRTNASPHEGFGRRSEFPAGTYRVPARQSRGRLAMTLLQPETHLDATYSYDVTAWSLPYAFGIEAHRADRLPDAGWSAVARVASAPLRVAGYDWLETQPRAAVPPEDGPAEPYGFLIAPGTANMPGVIRLLEEGGRVVALGGAFTLNGERWPAGTLLLARASNRGITDRIRSAGLESRAVAVASGLTSDGNDLGTERAYALRLPRLAVLTGPGVSPTSFGAHWFFLEQTVGLPFDALPAERLEDVDLGDYDVLVLPDMPASTLTEARRDVLRDWVRAGGHLVAAAGGARAAAPIAEIELRERDEETDVARALRGREERELERWEERIPGTILPGRVDGAHPLTLGAASGGATETLFVLHTGGATFEPDDRSEAVIHFPADVQRVSGVITAANLERLAQSSWLATRALGRGRMTLFADDPLFRHFWYGAWLPYLNALVLEGM